MPERTESCKSLSAFVGKESLNFFTYIRCNSDFLNKVCTISVAVIVDSWFLITSFFLLLQPQRLWANDEDFIKASEIVKSMEVVNDVAERSVKFSSEYICQTRYTIVFDLLNI